MLKPNQIPIIAITLILAGVIGFINPLILLLSFVVVLIFAIIKDFRIGTILLVVFSFTNYAGQQIFESFHLVLLTAMITLFSYVLAYLTRNATFRDSTRFNTPIVLFTVWSLFSGIIAFDHKMWYQNMEWLLRAIIVFFLIINSLSTVKHVIVVFKVIILSVFLSTFLSFFVEYGFAMFTPAALLSFFTKRFAGSIFDPNYFSMTVAASLPLAATMMIKEKLLFGKLFWLFVAMFLFFTIVISQSRTGLFSVSIVLLYSLYHFIKNRRREIWLIIAPLILIIVLLPPFFWYRLILFINKLTTGASGDISTVQRSILLLSALKVFLRNPLFGVGLGNFAHYSAQYIQYPMVCHNTYLEIAANLGIPGLILFLVIIYSAFVSLSYPKQNVELIELAWGTKAGFLGICTAILFLSVPFKLDLWVFLGLSAVIYQIAEEKCDK